MIEKARHMKYLAGIGFDANAVVGILTSEEADAVADVRESGWLVGVLWRTSFWNILLLIRQSPSG